MLKILPLLFLVLFGMGCSSSGMQRPDVGYGSEPVIESLDAKGLGDSVTLDGSRYSIAGQYFAASGRSCVRLEAESSASNRVACKSGRAGSWYARAPLSSGDTQFNQQSNHQRSIANDMNIVVGRTEIGEAAQESLLVSPESTSEIEPEAVPELIPLESIVQAPGESEQQSEPVTVKSGETLWKFAKRVTGNALNWSLIADHNLITDVTTIKGGDRLYIPQGLSRTDQDD